MKALPPGSECHVKCFCKKAKRSQPGKTRIFEGRDVVPRHAAGSARTVVARAQREPFPAWKPYPVALLSSAARLPAGERAQPMPSVIQFISRLLGLEKGEKPAGPAASSPAAQSQTATPAAGLQKGITDVAFGGLQRSPEGVHLKCWDTARREVVTGAVARLSPIQPGWFLVYTVSGACFRLELTAQTGCRVSEAPHGGDRCPCGCSARASRAEQCTAAVAGSGARVFQN